MLKIEPKEAVFLDIKPGVLYVMTISVRNMGHTASRIRLQAPKSTFFALNYIPSGPIAPGLDLRAEVEFQIPPDVPGLVFRDMVVATMGDIRVEIPLCAITPHANVSFDPIVNLGNIMLNQPVTKELWFENKSDIPATITLAVPKDASIQFSSTKIDLKAAGGEQCRVAVRLNVLPRALGPLRDLVKVKVSGVVEDLQMDISAKIIEQHLTLLTEDGQGMLERAQFGSLFFGESKVIRALLVNSGPFPMSFSIKYEDEDEASNPQSDVTSDGYERSLTVSPADGIVRPFSQVPVALTFAPVLRLPTKGFLQEHRKDIAEPRAISRTVRVECLDNMQTTVLACAGEACSPTVTVSPISLRFGECPVYDRRDILISLTNKTKLPTSFELPKLANFRFQPTSGTLLCGETVSVVASFVPSQMGDFKLSVPLSIAKDLLKVKLGLFGQSTSVAQKRPLLAGTEKLPADFTVQYKFVDPEETAEARSERKREEDLKALQLEASLRSLVQQGLGGGARTGIVDLGKGVDMNENKLDESIQSTIMMASQERDGLYDVTALQDKKLTSRSAPNESIALTQHREHNRIYNNYIQQSHTNRELQRMATVKLSSMARGAVDFSHPAGVNMGMLRGLDEPHLSIPRSDESLWTVSTAANSNGASNKLLVDENRLIQKKYSAVPKTQAEVRDCAMELPADQLKLIVSSHKLIDFGKVCVGSQSLKSFVVSNGLKHSCLVSIEDLDMELQQSKVLKQIIPESCIAGFDICFSSRVLGKVKKAFTWKVNDIHMFKVHVSAEVVPIILVMNKHELIMDFPQDLLKPTLTSDVVLTNPGNAYADYLWGNAGGFSCDPEKGSIAPGKSAVITVTWNPHVGKRQVEELGLHITGGVDQSLVVRGNLSETKAEFGIKRAALGVMAVGTEREVVTHISNTGENPLVFFLNPLDDQLGVRLEPTEAYVLPGESCEVSIKITPKVVRSYDNIVIAARVRGGKNINLKLAGSSIIPELEMHQSSLEFGNVTVGSNSKAPLIIANKSAIAATLVLDFTSFPEFFPRLLRPLEAIDVVAREFGESIPQQEDDSGNQIVVLPNVGQRNGGMTNSVAISGSITAPKKGRKKLPENVWKIIIQPNTQLLAEVVFKPSGARKHSFRLPLHLLGISTDKTLCKEVRAVGIASMLTVSQFVVNFDDRVVARDPLARSSYFMETSITNHTANGVSFLVQEGVEECQLFGGENMSGAVSFNEDSLTENPQIFFVSPLKADLPAGAVLKLRVTFQPQGNAVYNKKLGLILKGHESEAAPYLTLLAVGSGVYPCMSFSTSNLRMPTVPLGYTSRAMFTVYNNGYNALEVRHRVSPNISIPLEVIYPDGNQMGIMIEKIRVIVSARSEQPVSWFGKIEFFDADGERFFVNLSGCSDNCLLTNYSFVREYAEDYDFIGLDDQPVQYLSRVQIAEMRQTEAKRKEDLRRMRSLERQRAVESATGGKDADSQPTEVPNQKAGKKKGLNTKNVDRSNAQQLTYPNGIDLDKTSTIDRVTLQNATASEVAFLLNWLNRNVCRKMFDTDRFPHCITECSGDLVVDCIEQMSGKKINLKPADSGRLSHDRRSSPEARAEMDVSNGQRTSEKSKKIATLDKVVYKHQQILNFLVSQGALLGHINAIALLNMEDCMVLQEFELVRDKSVRITPALLISSRETWEHQWLENCSTGWLEVLYQAVKVFMLSRLNYREYCKLPGVVLTSKADTLTAPKSKADNASDNKKKAVIPKEFEASNVFSHGEAVLMAWCSYHLQHAESCTDYGADESAQQAHDISKFIGFNKRVVNMDQTFQDYFSFCQLVHSHVVDIAAKDDVLCGYTVCDRAQQQDHLFEMFEEAMRSYRLDLPGLHPEDILSSSRNIVMLLLHLYFTLPHLVPKTKVEFQGLLGVPMTKKIELKNTAKKPLKYRVSIKGSSDFRAESSEIIVPAEGSSELAVVLNARFVHPVTCKLYCWNVRDVGLAVGATLCFEFVSKIGGIKPTDSISREVALFDLETFPLTVKNPFDRECQFQIRLVAGFCEKSIEVLLKNIKGTSKKSTAPHVPARDIFKDLSMDKSDSVVDVESLLFSGKDEKNAAHDDWDVENIFRQPFWCAEESITIAKGASKTVSIFMLPFVLGKYQCEIVFSEKDLGEFSYKVFGDVGLPKPCDRLEVSLAQASKCRLAVNVNSKNNVFEKAYGIATDMRIKNANKKIKARNIFQGLLSSNVVNEMSGESEFCIEFTSTYFDCKRNLPFVSEYMKWPGTTANNNANRVRKNLRSSLDIIDAEPTGLDALNKAVFVFFPERAGQYKTTAVVYSKDNRQRDVRCVELSFIAKAADSKLQIDFSGPARKEICQEIPVTNDSDRDWMLAVSVSGPAFSAPKVLTVGAHSSELLRICFHSVAAGDYAGKLQLKNAESFDVFEYVLTGHSDFPLAEEILRFQCAARKRVTFEVQLPSIESINNKSKSCLLEVETDIPYVTCATSVEVSGAGARFPLNVFCPMGGALTGLVSFKDVDSGAVLWYTVQIDVTAPNEEKVIIVEATVRKAAVVEITLDNPTSDELDFKVFIQGDGLLGNSQFTLPPNGAKGAVEGDAYELFFSPLLPGVSTGRVSFFNDIVGEIWYKLQMTALPAEPIELGIVEAMVGTSSTLLAPIENPLGEQIVVDISVENATHFAVFPSRIVLAPFAQMDFTVSFCPSAVSETVSSQIILTSAKLGTIVYRVQGLGLLPGVMEEVTIEAAVHEMASKSVVFRNPFDHPLPVEVLLSSAAENENGKDCFSLLLRKSSELVVAAKNVLHVPVAFSPTRLAVFGATLLVRSNVSGRQLMWCYPIRGIPEAGPVSVLPRMQTKSKTTLMSEHMVSLSGLQAASQLAIGDFAVSLNVDDDLKHLVQRSFRLQVLDFAAPSAAGNPTLRCRLLFEPLRIFAATVRVDISHKLLGKWKLSVDLVATDPEPDDVIKLCARVHSEDSVSFALHNQFLGYSPFQAYFAHGSSPHFKVHPAAGTLPPYDANDGMTFTVTFAPIDYGVVEQATLIILTDDAQWSYVLKGAYPESNVASVKSKIDTKRAVPN